MLCLRLEFLLLGFGFLELRFLQSCFLLKLHELGLEVLLEGFQHALHFF